MFSPYREIDTICCLFGVMPAVRMAITPPEESYLTELPVDSSATSVRILALCDLGTQSRGVLEIRPSGDELQAVVDFLESREAIVSGEVLYADEDIGLVQYTTREPIVYFAALEAGATPVFPVKIHDGRLLIEGLMSYDLLSRFEEALESIDASFDIQFIKQLPSIDVIERSPYVDDLLTARQQQFILEAVEQGYYDTPRQCTLTELAESLDVTKGAASGLLHRAEERIVKEFAASLFGNTVEL